MELIQNKGELSTLLTVKISKEDYGPKVEKELKKARQVAQIKGFRPGKAPMPLVKRMYEPSILVDEINKLVYESLKEFQEKEERPVIGEIIPCDEKQPAIDWETQNEFEFVYEVGYYPEFNYQLNEDTEVTYYNIVPDKSELENEITYFRKQYGKLEDVDTIEDEDQVKVDVKIVKEGEETVHPSSFLMSMIPDEYKPLFSGKKIDDEIEVEIRKVFTNETDLLSMLGLSKEDLELQAEILPFTVKAISRVVPSELDQEFFDKVAGEDKVHSEEELKAYLAGQASDYYDKLSLNRLYIDSEEVLLEKADIALPEDFVKRLFLYLNKDKEDVTEEQIENAMPHLIKDLKWRYIVDNILKQEGFEITEEAIKEEAKLVVMDRLRRYGIYDFSQFNPDELVNYTLQNEEEVHNIINNLKADKFAKMLKEKAKLNTKDVDIKEFNDLYKPEQTEEEKELISEVEEAEEN